MLLSSPTAKANPLLKAIYDETNEAHFLFDDTSAKVFKALEFIQADMDNQAELYKTALMYELAYKKWKAGETLNYMDEHLLEMQNYKYKKAIRPAALLLLDVSTCTDCRCMMCVHFRACVCTDRGAACVVCLP